MALGVVGFGAAAPCVGEVCDETGLLQVTGKSSQDWLAVPSLSQHSAQHREQLELDRLEGVHKVHVDMKALAEQTLAERHAKNGNSTDYNLTRDEFALSNATLVVLDTVITQMQDLLQEINESHLADEQLLVDLSQGFVQCNMELATRQEQSNNLSSVVDIASTEHDACRSTQQSMAEAKATAWAHYYGNASYLAPPHDVKQCMGNFVSGYSPQTAMDLQAMTVCADKIRVWSGAFSTTMTSLGAAYDASHEAVGNQSQDCRVKQYTLESHFCEYRQQLMDSCSAMHACFHNMNSTWMELLTSVAASQTRREASYIAAKKVVCYVEVLKFNLTNPAVQACQSLAVDTSAIDVAIPSHASRDACETTPVAMFPCMQSWLDAEYYNKTWYTGSPQIQPDTCAGLTSRRLSRSHIPRGSMCRGQVKDASAGACLPGGCAMFPTQKQTCRKVATWTSLSISGPGPRRTMVMCGDDATSIYLHGGQDIGGPWPWPKLGDLWRLDLLPVPAWQLVSSQGPVRARHSGVWTGDSLLFFGGESSGESQELWKFSVSNTTWQQLANGPLRQARHSAIWRPDTQEMLIFGGRTHQADGSNDIHAYDYDDNAWAQIIPSNEKPPARRDHAAVWASGTKRMLVYGGFLFSVGLYANDVWSYDAEANAFWVAFWDF